MAAAAPATAYEPKMTCPCNFFWFAWSAPLFRKGTPPALWFGSPPYKNTECEPRTKAVQGSGIGSRFEPRTLFANLSIARSITSTPFETGELSPSWRWFIRRHDDSGPLGDETTYGCHRDRRRGGPKRMQPQNHSAPPRPHEKRACRGSCPAGGGARPSRHE